MNRRAWLLLIKVGVGRLHLVFPVLFPLLMYFMEMLSALKIYNLGKQNSKFYQILDTASQGAVLLEDLRAEGRFDFVDVEAEDKKDGKVVVKIALW